MRYPSPQLLRIIRLARLKCRCSQRRAQVGQRVAPDEMVEPHQVVCHDSALRLWPGDGMAESLVYHHLDGHPPIFERLTKLVAVGDGYASVAVSVLDQRGCACLLHVRDR